MTVVSVHCLRFALSIGHCFGIIPAPGSLASSAFPAPPNKLSNSAEDFLCPSPKADARIGSSIRSLWVAPITRAETEKENVPKQSSSHRLSRQEPGAQVGSSDTPQRRGSSACDSPLLE